MSTPDSRFGRLPGSPSAPPRRPAGVRVVAGLCLALASIGAGAGPVELDGAVVAPDPYELAARWTVASLTHAVGADAAGAGLKTLQPALPATLQGALAALQPAAPAAPQLPRFTGLPLSSGDAPAPDPGVYALMGLLLLGAGIAAHRLRRRRAPQRGFSKKT